MSLMAQEAAEAPRAVADFLDCNGKNLESLGRRLRHAAPPVVLTSARGSSDHAATYFKYLVEILVGVPCCSIGASVVSVYGAKLKVKDALCLTISQSGRSPDIVALQDAARQSGALTVALVNVEDSPVADSADICLPLCAGTEQSVAATKSLVTSLAAAAAVVASWQDDRELARAVASLPDTLDRALRLSWTELVDVAVHAESLYVLGRGPALPVAAETALKLKETCAIHAEAYSVAEVMHGPMELLGESFPVLVYSPDDASREAVSQAMHRLRRTGARLLAVEDGGLAYAASGNPFIDPVSMILTAYIAIERIARLRGRDPDRPRLLSKVTETL